MSPIFSRTKYISGILIVSLNIPVFTSENIMPVKEQNYTCKGLVDLTKAINGIFKNCEQAEMTINEKVVCDLTGCIPPMINRTLIKGCHIIKYRCFSNGSEEHITIIALLEGAKLTTMSGPYVQGESVRITCIAPKYNNAHSLRLIKDGKDTERTWITTQLAKHRVEFSIANITVEDSGNYTCSYQAEKGKRTFNSSKSNVVAINIVVTENQNETGSTGLSTGAIVAIISGTIFLVIIIIILVRWSEFRRFTTLWLKKFLPISSHQTRINWKKNSCKKNSTGDTSNDHSRPSEAEVVKFVLSGDGERDGKLSKAQRMKIY